MQEFDYKVKTAYSPSALSEWQFKSESNCETLVIPDGCQDIIVKQNGDFNNTCFVTELSNSAYKVPSNIGTCMRGIRLQPGMSIQTRNLNAWLANNDANKLFGSDQIDEFCSRSEGVVDALECLASDVQSVLLAAKELGVSIRSLQRLLKSETGLSPGFWLSLARARKAARALLKSDNLSDTAYTTGYCDQAHMNREMSRWFGHTPLQIRANREMHSMLFESGYG